METNETTTVTEIAAAQRSADEARARLRHDPEDEDAARALAAALDQLRDHDPPERALAEPLPLVAEAIDDPALGDRRERLAGLAREALGERRQRQLAGAGRGVLARAGLGADRRGAEEGRHLGPRDLGERPLRVDVAGERGPRGIPALANGGRGLARGGEGEREGEGEGEGESGEAHR